MQPRPRPATPGPSVDVVVSHPPRVRESDRGQLRGVRVYARQALIAEEHVPFFGSAIEVGEKERVKLLGSAHVRSVETVTEGGDGGVLVRDDQRLGFQLARVEVGAEVLDGVRGGVLVVFRRARVEAIGEIAKLATPGTRSWHHAHAHASARVMLVPVRTEELLGVWVTGGEVRHEREVVLGGAQPRRDGTERRGGAEDGRGGEHRREDARGEEPRARARARPRSAVVFGLARTDRRGRVHCEGKGEGCGWRMSLRGREGVGERLPENPHGAPRRVIHETRASRGRTQTQPLGVCAHGRRHGRLCALLTPQGSRASRHRRRRGCF